MPAEQRHHVAWPDRTYGPWRLELQFAPLAGRWELVGLAIRATPADLTQDTASASTGGPLTTALLRTIPLTRLIAEWRDERAQANRELVDTGAVWLMGLKGESWEGRQEARLDAEEAIAWLDRKSGASEPHAGRPLYWTDRRLMELAKIYADAHAQGAPPTAAVAAHFHLQHSGAAKLVQMARRRRLLPKTKRGKAGWLPPQQAPSSKPKEDST